MKNFIEKGHNIQVPAPAGGFLGGYAYKIGGLVGVAVSTQAEGEQTTIMLRGVYSDLPKATGTAWAQGDSLYWDDTAKAFTKTSSGNTFAGYAWVAAQSADATGTVYLWR